MHREHYKGKSDVFFIPSFRKPLWGNITGSARVYAYSFHLKFIRVYSVAFWRRNVLFFNTFFHFVQLIPLAVFFLFSLYTYNAVACIVHLGCCSPYQKGRKMGGPEFIFYFYEYTHAQVI